MKCVDEKTGTVIEEGTEVQSFRGQWSIVEAVWEPGTSQGGRGGRIQTVDGGMYFPSVFNAKFVD